MHNLACYVQILAHLLICEVFIITKMYTEFGL